jgi:hypothetical protein
VSRVRRHGAWLLVCALLAAPLLAQPAPAAEAAMAVEVGGGKWKAVRLRNLPKDARLAVAVQSDATLGVSLLKEQDFKRYPKPQEPLFMGSSERSLSFTVTVPETGTYYLLFDNRASSDARQVKFGIRAARAQPPGAPPTPGPRPAPQQQEF